MNKLSKYLLISFICCIRITSAQTWETLNPKPTANSFYNTCFINDSTGCMVTSEGEIFRTSNSGLTFDVVFDDNTYTFWGIDFIDDLKGFVAGQSGFEGNFIGKTTDGGLTWTKLSDPGGYTYFDVNFIDDMHGWICGWYNTVIRTTNGGDTWQRLSGSVLSNNLFSTCDFINQDTGFIGGMLEGYPFKAVLFKTFNGGATLQPIELPALSEEIADIEMISENEIWLCEGHQVQGNTRLYHSTDAGITWQTVNIGLYTSPGQKIIFIDSLKGRVVGGGSCFSTEDGGQTWSHYYYFPDCSGYMFSGDWINENIGYVAGQNGSIAKSSNGGISWTEISSGSRGAFCDIAFANSQTGCAVGSQQGIDFIYHTSDGGETWTSALNSTNNNGWIYDVMYSSETEAWASGNMNRVYHSTDGGCSWTTFNPTNNEQNHFFSLCKVSDGRIYAGGSQLLYTDDHGANWQWNDFEYPGYQIRKVIFTDPLNGFLMLWESEAWTIFYGKMFRTRDGGITWEDIDYNLGGVSSKILAADFINKDTGIISIYGSGLALTTDGGDTWDLQGYNANMEISYLKMFNEKEVVATTRTGDVFYSYDGGITWYQVEITDVSSPPVSTMNNEEKNNRAPFAPGGVDGFWGTFFTGMDLGWKCGDGGLIKKYTYLTVDVPELNIQQQDECRLFPNPASTSVNITGIKTPDQIIVYNSYGKRIQQFYGSVKNIDVTNWPGGAYLIQFIIDQHHQTLRFVKK